MAELVDALVSNTSGAIHPGSIPGLGTQKSCKHLIYRTFLFISIPPIFQSLKPEEDTLSTKTLLEAQFKTSVAVNSTIIHKVRNIIQIMVHVIVIPTSCNGSSVLYKKRKDGSYT